MKIFILLFSILLLASCSPKTNQAPSIGETIVTHSQLVNILHSYGAEGYAEILDDNKYCITTKEWVEYFLPLWKKELFDKKLNVYQSESNDCDKFSNRARMFAQELNNQTDNRGECSLAVGKVNYLTDGGTFHACILFVIKNKNDIELLFVEPDMFHPDIKVGIIELSKVEISNIQSLEF